MKVVALVSGGKDSCYAMQLCRSYGHEIVALANLYPVDEDVDELDSYMYQTVGHQVITALSQCMGLPLFRRKIQGQTREKGLRYTKTYGDEVEDLEALLRAVKSRFPEIGGVSSGAIASDYQRLRVENVCSRLGLISLAYMWKQEQPYLLQNMIDSGLHAVLVKVRNMISRGALPDSFAPVGVLHPLKFHLEPKSDAWAPDSCSAIMCDDVSNMPASTESVAQSASDAPGPSLEGITLGESQPKGVSVLVNRQQHGFVVLSCSRLSDEDATQGTSQNFIWFQLLRLVSAGRTGVASVANKMMNRLIFRMSADIVAHSTCYGFFGSEVQDELDDLLKAAEVELRNEKLSWADVIYVHLYLKDMSKFVKANEKYMAHITEKLCLRGVPSRCCVELPLVESGMGVAVVEILAARCESKEVLHVQSISSWAPSCIGPYSQATLFQGLLYMAGQLGLDPPTMSIVSGGGADEMLQALRNCEAVGNAFTSSQGHNRKECLVLSFSVYCSSGSSVEERKQVEGVIRNFFQTDERMFTDVDDRGCHRAVNLFRSLPGALFLYILVPALPKGALVEVAPLSHITRLIDSSSEEDDEQRNECWRETLVDLSLVQREANSEGSSCQGSTDADESDLQHGQRIYLCAPCKGLILPHYLCRAVSYILPGPSEETSTSRESVQALACSGGVVSVGTHDPSTSGQGLKAAGRSGNGATAPSQRGCSFTDAMSECMESMSRTLEDASLCWADVVTFRLYFVGSVIRAHDVREAIEVAMARCCKHSPPAPVGPRPTLVPVIALGENSDMQALMGVELTASGFLAKRL
ncbi:hypothetical protein AXG93_115s1150 [Marchantia polymorpha subsp. ruderalis]|uniref:Diphthine--ammonia ligase n=1 Tax=Marchantia polymorpha subsp. ruderalis TaxID=1480154 RepID=A0A176W8E1_MARPO|nr:hypothetical protein AXG93_115s1150 [Marchantia polymorpha subsp. ruderalis]